MDMFYFLSCCFSIRLPYCYTCWINALFDSFSNLYYSLK